MTVQKGEHLHLNINHHKRQKRGSFSSFSLFEFLKFVFDIA